MCTDPRPRSDHLTEASNDHIEAVDRSDDESYVIVHWNQERFYNFFFSGDSVSYDRGGYEAYVSHSHPDEAYAEDAGFGYLVTRPIGGLLDGAHVQLHHAQGLGDDPASHFQLLYAGEEFNVFAIVEGAQLQITGEANSTVTVSTDVDVPGASETFERTVTLTDGPTTVVVPYPGEYTVGDETVSVSQLDVEHGETVNVTVTDQLATTTG